MSLLFLCIAKFLTKRTPSIHRLSAFEGYVRFCICRVVFGTSDPACFNFCGAGTPEKVAVWGMWAVVTRPGSWNPLTLSLRCARWRMLKGRARTGGHILTPFRAGRRLKDTTLKFIARCTRCHCVRPRKPPFLFEFATILGMTTF